MTPAGQNIEPGCMVLLFNAIPEEAAQALLGTMQVVDQLVPYELVVDIRGRLKYGDRWWVLESINHPSSTEYAVIWPERYLLRIDPDPDFLRREREAKRPAPPKTPTLA